MYLKNCFLFLHILVQIQMKSETRMYYLQNLSEVSIRKLKQKEIILQTLYEGIFSKIK